MDSSYNEGWNDASKHFIESHISTEEFSSLLDKFFDKISDLKEIANWFYLHHEDYDISGNKMINDITKENNLKLIMDRVKKLENNERKQKNVSKKIKKG